MKIRLIDEVNHSRENIVLMRNPPSDAHQGLENRERTVPTGNPSSDAHENTERRENIIPMRNPPSDAHQDIGNRESTVPTSNPSSDAHEKTWGLVGVGMRGRRSVFGRLSQRLDDVTVDIPSGVTAVLGESGAGKTSLLNALVEFEPISAGTITFRPPRGTRLALFWSPPTHGLWPHLTVAEHLLTVSRAAGNGDEECVRRLLDAFDLGSLRDARPGSLSLGERSRLSIARALASHAAVLVMDEPLAHVDSSRLGSYWSAIREHCQCTGASLVFATHSAEVVLREADFAICLDRGRLSYAGSTSELYDRPPTQALARLLGPCNWLSPDEGTRWLAGHDATCQTSLCVRPERLLIEPNVEGHATVVQTRFGGSSSEVDLVDAQDGVQRTFIHRPPGRAALNAGDRVLLKVLMLFCVLLFTGCGSEPALPVTMENYWNIPPNGPRVPAPRGMTVTPDGEYLVLDNAGRILVYDESGDVQRQWWMPEYSVGKPEGVRVLKDGRIAVADTHYHRVVFFDHDGNVTGMFGELGTGPGQFIYPVSVTQDDEENLYICEYGNYNDRAQKFRPDGTYLAQIGSYGTGDGQFQRPSGAAWYDGRLYVVDAFNNRVQVFDAAGKLVAILGSSDKISELYYPYDITVSDGGELFVVEYGGGRVSKLSRSGKLLGRYGTSGNGRGQFLTPWGLAVDHQGRVYVCDTGNHRIVELRM